MTLRGRITVSVGVVALAFAMLSPSRGADSDLVERDPVTMIHVPEGAFRMGNAPGEGRADATPARTVFVDAFFIDEVEVTNRRYEWFVHETGHRRPPNPYDAGPLLLTPFIAELPVVQVTWHDAADYCQWAGKRLPTEAEWEKAARGTDGRRYPWGNDPPTPHHATFDREWDGVHTLHAAGTRPEGRSPYGVHDLAGNAREWVEDWYDAESYRSALERNPQGPASGVLKVIRGGSWHSPVADIAAAARGRGGFALRTHGTGFRCARSPSGIEGAR
jgi:formylglycine-generating enzyme required for sulfatase activity